MKRLILSLLLGISGVLTSSILAGGIGVQDVHMLLTGTHMLIIAPVQFLIAEGGDLSAIRLVIMVATQAAAILALLTGLWTYRRFWGKGLLYVSGVLWIASMYVELFV